MRASYEYIFSKKTALPLIALFCCLLWGLGFPIIKLGYEALGIDSNDTFSQLLFAGVRFGCGGAVMLIILTVKNKPKSLPSVKAIPSILLLALVYSVLQYVFQYIGISRTAGSTSSIINQSGTFLLVFLSPLFIKEERLTARKSIGAIIGFLGIIIVNFKENMSFRLSFMGEGFIFLASLSSAIGYIISKKLTKNQNAATVTAIHQTIGGIILTVVGLIGGGRFTSFGIKGFFILLFLTFSAAAANALWLTLIKHNDVATVSVYKLTVPFFGVLFSGIFLNEKIITLPNALALIAVCAGIAITNGATLRNKGKGELK
ncbi:MAG: DMT family transporter [Clostridia bacterium]|nr:DMT family transporter [Clostridia bacterium]